MLPSSLSVSGKQRRQDSRERILPEDARLQAELWGGRQELSPREEVGLLPLCCDS